MPQAKIIGEPTPPEVMDAIQTIAAYLRRGGWVEVIVTQSGGASFNLTSVYDLIPGCATTSAGVAGWNE